MKFLSWEPSDIFYKQYNFKVSKYDPLDISSDKEYTKLGKWIKSLPGILAYPIVIVIYFIVGLIWAICGILYVLIQLLTKPIWE